MQIYIINGKNCKSQLYYAKKFLEMSHLFCKTTVMETQWLHVLNMVLVLI